MSDILTIFDTSVFYVQCLAEVLKEKKVYSKVIYYFDSDTLLESFKNDTSDYLLFIQNSMHLNDVLDLKEELQKLRSDLKIAMVGDYNALADIRKLYEQGISCYLEKESELSELKAALEAMQRGENYVCNAVKTRMLEDLLFQEGDNDTQNESLTNREIEVTRLICEGMSSKMISEKLFISVNTVETHRKKILLKLNVKNSLGIMKYAIENNLLK